MILKQEISLRYFEFWGGAKDRAEKLTDEQIDTIESELSILYDGEMTATDLNDIFWFDFDYVAQILGYEDEEDFLNSINESEKWHEKNTETRCYWE